MGGAERASLERWAVAEPVLAEGLGTGVIPWAEGPARICRICWRLHGVVQGRALMHLNHLAWGP